MCGIFGFLTRRPEDTARVDLRAALRALRHRGPDGEGIFEGSVGDLGCGLAHTRLAITDLSPAGHQPMTSGDHRYVIVHNGEIENHAEIRGELSRDGIPFRSTSDTEVIVEAYARWGPASLDRLRGMFAFAIWDRRLGDLFIARDRLGIKPLYVTTGGHAELAFASEIRTLIATRVIDPRLSMAGVAGYLQWGSVPEPATILEDVRALMPGSYIQHRNGRTDIVRYWKPRCGTPKVNTFDEAVEHVAPIVREAVSLGLVADVPVGVFLSGGIDSSVITALAATRQSRPLDTFTVAFDAKSTDEAIHAAGVASRYGCNHHEVRLDATTFADDLDEAIAALDQPSADGINTFFVAKAVAASGISVVLSGLGADELFGGYHLFREFGAANRLAGLLPSSSADLLDRVASQPFLPSRSSKLVGLLTAPHNAFGAYGALRCMFTPAHVRRLLQGLVMRAPPSAIDAATELDVALTDPVNAYSLFELTHYVPNTLLRDADVMSMVRALEVRVPLLDHRLVEAVLDVPGRFKVGGRTNKPLLVACAPGLPDAVSRREKVGFTLPWDDWLRGALRPRVDDLFGASSLSRIGWLDTREATNLWTSYCNRDRGVTSSRIWCIAALVAWCEKNGITA